MFNRFIKHLLTYFYFSSWHFKLSSFYKRILCNSEKCVAHCICTCIGISRLDSAGYVTVFIRGETERDEISTGDRWTMSSWWRSSVSRPVGERLLSSQPGISQPDEPHRLSIHLSMSISYRVLPAARLSGQIRSSTASPRGDDDKCMTSLSRCCFQIVAVRSIERLMLISWPFRPFRLLVLRSLGMFCLRRHTSKYIYIKFTWKAL